MKSTNLLVLAICAVCVVADIKFGREIDAVSRIVGGHNAEEGQFPYQISLRHYLSFNFCGGSIISNRFLLSAAHCTIKAKPNEIFAFLGALKYIGDGVEVKLAAIVNHPYFSFDERTNDISLLRTAEEITFTKHIQPIALPTHDLTKDRIEAIVSGWGKSSSERSNQPNILQFTKTTAVSHETCIKQFKGHVNTKFVRKSNVCTIYPVNVGACFGDSGGPLVDVSNPQEKTLIGIVSWAVPCGQGYPDVFTRVFSFLGWIEHEMTKLSQE